MAYENIETERHGKVALVRLDRPKALNALNSALMDELNMELDAYEADEGIGCVVITGSDKAFAAGADVKQMQALNFVDAYMGDFITSWDRVARMRLCSQAA